MYANIVPIVKLCSRVVEINYILTQSQYPNYVRSYCNIIIHRHLIRNNRTTRQQLKPTFNRLTYLCDGYTKSWTHLVSCRVPSCPCTARTFRTHPAWIRFSWRSAPTTAPWTARTSGGSKAFRGVFGPDEFPYTAATRAEQRKIFYSQLDPKCRRTNTSPPPPPLPHALFLSNGRSFVVVTRSSPPKCRLHGPTCI